ncbi:P-loop containing nucleoside triphosphate hydrolase protein [Halteromyces radiatus]|uniref:P-loop containing nucleoside triphosphate hydrolase protein n=1 Tax=Halteromyces radiatus TaxID=101107 RepID=UPI00221F5153|nr:P-loop containing nucleoside triphosphate hydrolase protein [Halteromyces radiatus]KAI8078647.1 P-loop containing nucleoside triphosphate hydrolase protein [Halteromyces radiatus]
MSDKEIISNESSSTTSPAKKEEIKNPSIPIYKLFRYSDNRDKFLICIAILCSAGVGALQPAAIIIFGTFLDRITTTIALTPPIDGAPIDYIATTLPVILILVYMAIGILVASYAAQTLWIITGENQTRRIRMKYLHAILRQDMAWFDASKEGSLTTRLTSDTQLIQEGLSEKFGLFVSSIAQFISGIVVGFTGDWLLSLVIIATFPILAIAAAIMGVLVTRYTTKAQDAYADAGQVAEQAFGGIRTVSAFNMEHHFVTRYLRELKKATYAGVKRAVVFGLGSAIFLFVFFSTYALSFWYGSTLVNKGHITGANVVISFFGVILGAIGLITIPQNLTSITSACGAAYNIYSTIERIPDIDPDDIKHKHLPQSWHGNVEFKDIFFSYPTRSDVSILNDVNISIPSGSTVALVGLSGSGKSTLMQLLQRFYDPNDGSILLDGQDIKSLDVSWLRENIGVVSQEPVLFNLSIEENIRLGALHTTSTITEIEQACKIANCHDFISKLPEGYNTIVGENAAFLSGGQKQRIAIARAILKNPKILLLDEATSALDTKSERLVQHALDIATVNRTTIMIAHRLSTIRNADKIVVMDKGKVVEQGTHEELVAFGGIYSDLVNKQTIAQEQHVTPMTTDSSIIEGFNADTSNINNNIGINRQDNNTISDGEPATTTKVVEDLIEQEKVAIEMMVMDKHDMDNEKNQDTNTTSTKQQQQQQQQQVSMLRVIKEMNTEWFLLLLGCFGSVIAGCIFPAFGYVFSQVVVLITEKGGLVSDGPMQGANLYSFLLMIVGVAGFVGFGTKIICFELAGERYTERLRHQVFCAYLRQEVGYYDDPENTTGALTTKLAVDAKNVNELITKTWGEIIQTVLTGIAGLIIAFVLSWQLTLVILGVSPFLIAGALYEAKIEQGFGDPTKKANEQCGEIASEAIKEIRTVASLNQQVYFENRFYKATERPHQMTTKKAWAASFGYACTQGVPLFAQAIAFYAGMRFIANGWITYNQMFTSMMMVLVTALGVGSGLVFTKTFVKGKLSANAIFEAIDRQPTIDPDLEGVEPSSDSIQGVIDFENVKFTYPTRPDHPVFHGDLNIQVDALKKIALVGSSGCGKSTTIGMLQRWYDTDSGSIRLDHQDIRSFTLSNLRSHMALVSQEPTVFDISIGDNIRLGYNNKEDEISFKEMEDVCRLANIHDFIQSLPEGYDTTCGNKGSQLSGGQKQRIAIARALIRKPKVLLLDEATSALDSESEKLVQEALDQVLEQGGRTTITIAHRLSTIQDSNMIYVIDNGHVMEKGNHQQLLEMNGLYAQLVLDQSLKTF